MLLVIFLKSLSESSLPPDRLKANVSPSFKKGGKSSPSDYRPISTYLHICKLLEHIIISNIVRHLNDKKFFYEVQHGFRANRSCEIRCVCVGVGGCLGGGGGGAGRGRGPLTL